MGIFDKKTVVPNDPCDKPDCLKAQDEYYQALLEAQISSDKVKIACKEVETSKHEIAMLGLTVGALASAYAACITLVPVWFQFVSFVFFKVSLCDIIKIALAGAIIALGIAVYKYMRARQQLETEVGICQGKQADLQKIYNNTLLVCGRNCVGNPNLPSCACN